MGKSLQSTSVITGVFRHSRQVATEWFIQEALQQALWFITWFIPYDFRPWQPQLSVFRKEQKSIVIAT